MYWKKNNVPLYLISDTVGSLTMSFLSKNSKWIAGFAITGFLCVGNAACRENSWKNFHQYHSKGKVHELSFKLKGIDRTTIWLHCSSGHPNQKVLEEFSTNVTCRIIKNTFYKNALGLTCHYKKLLAQSCINVRLQCQ